MTISGQPIARTKGLPLVLSISKPMASLQVSGGLERIRTVNSPETLSAGTWNFRMNANEDNTSRVLGGPCSPASSVLETRDSGLCRMTYCIVPAS